MEKVRGPGQEEQEEVTVRRSESADAPGIDRLIGPSAQAVFGRINVLQLLDKASLAVTVADQKNRVLAHASFLDHPAGPLVDRDHWELFLHRHFGSDECTSLNTLFLHLFVAKTTCAAASVKEIMRAVFNAVPELQHICLVCPDGADIEPALEQVFEPLQPRTHPGSQCLAFICHREGHSPRLHVRPARPSDYKDIRALMDQHAGPGDNIPEMIETQNQNHHAAVFQSGESVVGFISVSVADDVETFQNFDLSEFEDFYKVVQKNNEPAEPTESEGEDVDQNPLPAQEVWSQQEQSTRRSSETLNAFCIQLFSIQKKHESRSGDCMPYLFQCFPNLNYCTFLVSTMCPEMPLLENFLWVASLPSSSLTTGLYVAHRNGFRNVDVRPAVAADQLAVSDLVKNISLNESIIQDLDSFIRTQCDPDAVPLQAFVAQVDSHVVGIIIIQDEQDIEFLRAHYNIENFIYFSHHGYEEHANIRHFILKRCFQNLTRQLFKEVLRQAHKSCLFLRIYPARYQQESSCVHPLEFVLNCAVSVRPRRQIFYPLEELGTNGPSLRLMEKQAPFALSLISRKLTLEPKVSVNSRIVVVGASDTSLSFLEMLCLCPHLKFNNLTLVSTHGFHGDYEHKAIEFLATSHSFSSGDLERIPLLCSINVVTGKMLKIRRKSRHILLSGGERVQYDYLILCTGLQYQVPCPTGVDVTQPITNRSEYRYTGTVPSNLFTINDLHDCMAARHWLTANFVQREDDAIIYGNSIDVYTSIQTLMSLGIHGSRIHLVLLPLDPSVSSSFHSVVEKALAGVLCSSQVQVHRSFVLAQINNGEHPDPITSVSFISESESLHLGCGVFINLSNKGVDYNTLDSITSAFLTFDSRLVINASFRTSDSAIYAAGPLTKFSSSYFSDEWSHTNFNSKEVGQELAAMVLSLFDPSLKGHTESEVDCLVPMLKLPKIQGGTLPGGFHFLHVDKPSATKFKSPVVHYGIEIVTGQAETGNYFCLRLNHHEQVETITCLSLKPLPSSNYMSLYGKHQELLGQLLTRYRHGLIQDLYSFFRQAWCWAVFHDRFCDLQMELRRVRSELEEADADVDVLSLETEADSRVALRSRTVNFLMYNRNLLPMFATPGRHLSHM